jgi:hypothetical protein
MPPCRTSIRGRSGITNVVDRRSRQMVEDEMSSVTLTQDSRECVGRARGDCAEHRISVLRLLRCELAATPFHPGPE